jgi:hypothetical protein
MRTTFLICLACFGALLELCDDDPKASLAGYDEDMLQAGVSYYKAVTGCSSVWCLLQDNDNTNELASTSADSIPSNFKIPPRNQENKTLLTARYPWQTGIQPVRITLVDMPYLTTAHGSLYSQ